MECLQAGLPPLQTTRKGTTSRGKEWKKVVLHGVKLVGLLLRPRPRPGGMPTCALPRGSHEVRSPELTGTITNADEPQKMNELTRPRVMLPGDQVVVSRSEPPTKTLKLGPGLLRIPPPSSSAASPDQEQLIVTRLGLHGHTQSTHQQQLWIQGRSKRVRVYLLFF
jgi:hypothetical protein